VDVAGMGTHFAGTGAGGGIPCTELTVGAAGHQAGLTLGEAQAEHLGILESLYAVLQTARKGVEEGDLAIGAAAEHELSLGIDEQVVHTVDVGEGFPGEYEDILFALNFP